jgi:hypothetical protein
MNPRDIATQARFVQRESNQSSRQSLGQAVPAIECKANSGLFKFNLLLAGFLDESARPFDIPSLCFGKIAQGP